MAKLDDFIAKKKKVPSKNKKGSVPPDYDVILPGMGYTKPTATKQPTRIKPKPTSKPKKPMTFREYEKRRDFLVDTAETKKQQKKLPEDLARLKANYEKAKAKKIKPAPMPKGPKSPMETGVRSKPRRGNIKPKKK
jgi:hypothetical protein